MLPKEWKPIHQQADDVVHNYVVKEVAAGEICGCKNCRLNANNWIDWMAFGKDHLDKYKYDMGDEIDWDCLDDDTDYNGDEWINPF